MLFDERSCCRDDMCQQERPTPYMGAEGFTQPWDDLTMQQSWDDRYGCPPACPPVPACPPAPVCPPAPIVEPPIERCVKRDLCHEVKHICPIHTRIINNHIVRHTYSPQFTCSEQNVVTNLQLGSCCDFV